MTTEADTGTAIAAARAAFVHTEHTEKTEISAEASTATAGRQTTAAIAEAAAAEAIARAETATADSTNVAAIAEATAHMTATGRTIAETSVAVAEAVAPTVPTGIL